MVSVAKRFDIGKGQAHIGTGVFCIAGNVVKSVDPDAHEVVFEEAGAEVHIDTGSKGVEWRKRIPLVAVVHNTADIAVKSACQPRIQRQRGIEELGKMNILRMQTQHTRSHHQQE